jgi:hypothetical protein
MLSIGLLAAFLSSASPGFATPSKLAVLDFSNPAGLQAQEVAYASVLVRGVAARLPRAVYTVMTKENIMVLLPPGTDLAQCTSAMCEVEFGRKVGADLVVAGQIARVGTLLKVSMTLHETREGGLLGTETASVDNVERLEGPVRAAAARLLSVLPGAAGLVAGGGRAMVGDGTVTEGVRFDRGESIQNEITDDTGYLVIRTTPDKATLFLNSQEIGTAPLQREEMVGRYMITAELGRHHPARQEVDLTTKGATVELALKSAYGALQVLSEPSGAEVWLEGERVGRTPWEALEKLSGSYRLEVKKEHHLSFRDTVVVQDGETTPVTAHLKANFGGLSITSDPAGARIVLNERDTGETTPATFPVLKPGVYVVKLSLTGHGEAAENASVRVGATESLDVALERKLGLLSVMAAYEDGAPCEADLVVDGKARASTPTKVEVLAEVPHEVLVRCAGRDLRRHVTVGHNEKESLDLRFDGAVRASVTPSRAAPATGPTVRKQASPRDSDGLGLGLSFSEGFVSYDGSVYRSHVGFEGMLAYRLAFISFDVATGRTLESPALGTVRPGVRAFLDDAYARLALQWAWSDGNSTWGALLGAGYAIPLATSWSLPIELDATFFRTAIDVVPIELRAGVQVTF